MKLPRGFITILALYVFIHHMEALEVGGPTQELINSICTETVDYELCKEIIHKHLDTKTMNLFDLTHLIFRIATEHASDTYVFIGNILREHPDPEETTGLNTCLTAYTDETSTFLKVRHEFCQEDYERMIIDILSTRKILKRCRTDFQIPLNKKKLLIEKSRVMKILINMSAVSGSKALLDKNTQQRVDAICKQTIDNKFCKGIFAKKLVTSSPSNTDLMNVTVTEGERNSAKTYFFISTLLRDAGDERSGLQKCADAYAIVNIAFTDAVSFFNKGLYGEILKLTGKLSKGVGICKTDFNVPGYHINPMVEKNRETKVLVAMEEIIGHMVSS
ncbi:hypothetical protein HID58_021118 [Brassica napus]|uniref:Pectinesterase inhibitor domain-containing protein n=1 Tax=Brassica napus TaxID=3708 RepID=A0ABQ8CXQ4_BRANA|nr:hypothetical protein HID58_021118 [Brassica napus]